MSKDPSRTCTYRTTRTQESSWHLDLPRREANLVSEARETLLLEKGRRPWDLGGALGLVTQGLICTKLMAILLGRNGEDMKIGARFFLEPSHFVSSGLCRLGNFWR